MNIKQLLSVNNFEFNKKFGQNFITDTNLLNAIVKDTGITREDEVLEIGTGAGTLTQIIAENCKKVITYEIDKKLTEILQATLSPLANCVSHITDVMKMTLSQIEDEFEGKYHIIANLPYYITTPIIFKFLNSSKLITMNIMVQKEVAERICAKPNTKNYGIISILINAVADAKISRIVNRNMFTPPPNVDSAIVQITKNNKYPNLNIEQFGELVHCSFAMRRKTLVNNLSTYYQKTKDEITSIINPLSPNIRAESLTIEDFIMLCDKIYK